MFNYRVLLVSTVSAFLIACGAGTPVEDSAGVPTAPVTGAATGDITAPDAPDSNTGGANPDTSNNSVSLPVSCSASDNDIQVRMLDLINTARAEARACGTTPYAATSPLTWDAQLLSAAKVHSADMAQHNFFSHTGSDGSSVADRATTAGFIWQRIGENIAAGQRSAEDAINGWLDSPGHCENLMNPSFTHVSVACVENSGSDYSRYWTNVLGTRF